MPPTRVASPSNVNCRWRVRYLRRDTLLIQQLSQRLGSEKADLDSILFAIPANLFVECCVDGDYCVLLFGFHSFSVSDLMYRFLFRGVSLMM